MTNELVSIWQGNEDAPNTFKDAINKITEDKPNIDRPTKQKNSQYTNIVTTIPVPETTMQINGEDITYAMVRFNYVVVTDDEDPVPDDGYIIIFSGKSMPIRYLIDRTSTNAQPILQLLLNNYNRSVMVYDVTRENDADFLFWLFAQYIDITSEDSLFGTNLSIANINTVRGSISENITKVTAKSNLDVANYISVLSFLLETDEVDSLGLTIEYNGHVVEIIIERPRVKQKVSVNINSYMGPFDDLNTDDKISKVLLLVHMEILPRLRTIYTGQEKDWVASKRGEFVSTLATKIKEKVDAQVKLLSTQLEQDAE